MSGKLIMKRKLDKTHKLLDQNKKKEETSTSSTSSFISRSNKINNREPENKRMRSDTPPPETEELDLPTLPQVTTQNRHLLEAIQLKILELQNELDAFEHDVEIHEEHYLNNSQNNQISEQEAEALGFAMCAQETMMFLQRECVPSDSILYTGLRDALVGSTQPEHKLHV